MYQRPFRKKMSGNDVVYISDDNEKSINPNSFHSPKQRKLSYNSIRKRRDLRTGVLKPITPSSTIQSIMKASLVFDLSTSLRTNTPEVAIATLRSLVSSGREYPSDLLYTEFLEHLQSVENFSFTHAIQVYRSLIYCYDQAISCTIPTTFPYIWDPIELVLTQISNDPIDATWRRRLLIVQFYVYCFQMDFQSTRRRRGTEINEIKSNDIDVLEAKSNEMMEQNELNWIGETRIYRVFQQNTSEEKQSSTNGSTKRKRRLSKVSTSMDNHILTSITQIISFYKRVYEDIETECIGENVSTDDFSEESPSNLWKIDAQDTAMACLRLLELLCCCTTQLSNVLQRIDALVSEMKHETQVQFASCLQSKLLRIHLSTTIMGLTTKSRSKDTKWLECNAIGRIHGHLEQSTNASPKTACSIKSSQIKVKRQSLENMSHDIMVYSNAHLQGYKISNTDRKSPLQKLLQEILMLQQM